MLPYLIGDAVEDFDYAAFEGLLASAEAKRAAMNMLNCFQKCVPLLVRNWDQTHPESYLGAGVRAFRKLPLQIMGDSDVAVRMSQALGVLLRCVSHTWSDPSPIQKKLYLESFVSFLEAARSGLSTARQSPALDAVRLFVRLSGDEKVHAALRSAVVWLMLEVFDAQHIPHGFMPRHGPDDCALLDVPGEAPLAFPKCLLEFIESGRVDAGLLLSACEEETAHGAAQRAQFFRQVRQA